MHGITLLLPLQERQFKSKFNGLFIVAFGDVDASAFPIPIADEIFP